MVRFWQSPWRVGINPIRVAFVSLTSHPLLNTQYHKVWGFDKLYPMAFLIWWLDYFWVWSMKLIFESWSVRQSTKLLIHNNFAQWETPLLYKTGKWQATQPGKLMPVPHFVAEVITCQTDQYRGSYCSSKAIQSQTCLARVSKMILI